MNPFRLLAVAALTLVSMALFIGAALAQTTNVSLPIGDWIGMVLPIGSFIIMVLLIVGLGYLIRLLPPWAQALASVAIQKQLIGYASDALNIGIQKIKDATKGQVLEVNVGNAVIAAAAQEAINTWPKAVIDKLGGLDGIKKWLLTQAEDHGVILDPSTTAADILNSPAVKSVTGNPL